MLALGPLTFRHEPTGDADGEIAGHLHPSARIAWRGRAVSRRCFATDGKRVVMPAFGAYTGGLNIRDRAFARVFGCPRFHRASARRATALRIPCRTLRGLICRAAPRRLSAGD